MDDAKKVDQLDAAVRPAEAVLRAPNRIFRQHDHSRQSDPAGAAARRRTGIQQPLVGTEPAAPESARLFRSDQARERRFETERQGRHGGHSTEGEGKGQAIDQLHRRRERIGGQLRRASRIKRTISSDLAKRLLLSAQIGNIQNRHTVRIYGAVSFRPAAFRRGSRSSQAGWTTTRRARKDCCWGSRWPSIRRCRRITTRIQRASRCLRAIRCGGRLLRGSACNTAGRRRTSRRSANRRRCSSNTRNSRALAGPSALNGIRQSSITPTFSYSTVNNPRFSDEREKHLLRTLRSQAGRCKGMSTRSATPLQWRTTIRSITAAT